jgi:serine/threonine protein kinase
LLDTDTFGAMHLGVLTNILGFRQRVILKTARDNTPEQHKLLQAELDLMANIGDHENVLKIFGAKSIGSNGRLCVITEYCEQGSLANFLSEKHKLDLFIDEIVLSNLQKDVIGSNCLRTKFFVSYTAFDISCSTSIQ